MACIKKHDGCTHGRMYTLKAICLLNFTSSKFGAKQFVISVLPKQSLSINVFFLPKIPLANSLVHLQLGLVNSQDNVTGQSIVLGV